MGKGLHFRQVLDCTSAIALTKLTSHSTRHSQARVNIGEEPGRVLLDLTKSKSLTSINPVHHQSRSERSDQTSHTPTNLALAFRVRERQPRRPSRIDTCLMDMRRRLGRRLVLALEVEDGDVVADGVEVDVDAEGEDALGAWQAARAAGAVVHLARKDAGVADAPRHGRAGDDLVGGRVHDVGGGEGEDAGGDGEAGVEVVVGVLLFVGDAFPAVCGGVSGRR